MTRCWSRSVLGRSSHTSTSPLSATTTRTRPTGHRAGCRGGLLPEPRFIQPVGPGVAAAAVRARADDRGAGGEYGHTRPRVGARDTGGASARGLWDRRQRRRVESALAGRLRVYCNSLATGPRDPPAPDRAAGYRVAPGADHHHATCRGTVGSRPGGRRGPGFSPIDKHCSVPGTGGLVFAAGDAGRLPGQTRRSRRADGGRGGCGDSRSQPGRRTQGAARSTRSSVASS